MKANIGTIDRGIRIILGVLALVGVFIGPLSTGGWPQIAIGVVGVILIATSSFKFCPLYRLLGLRTCPID